MFLLEKKRPKHPLNNAWDFAIFVTSDEDLFGTDSSDEEEFYMKGGFNGKEEETPHAPEFKAILDTCGIRPGRRGSVRFLEDADDVEADTFLMNKNVNGTAIELI